MMKHVPEPHLQQFTEGLTALVNAYFAGLRTRKARLPANLYYKVRGHAERALMEEYKAFGPHIHKIADRMNMNRNTVGKKLRTPPPSCDGAPELQQLVDDIASHLGNYFVLMSEAKQSPGARLTANVINALEKSLISNVMEFCEGNQLASSAILGINRNTLRALMRKYVLEPVRRPKPLPPEVTTRVDISALDADLRKAVQSYFAGLNAQNLRLGEGACLEVKVTRALQKVLIEEMLKACGNCQLQAAAVLGINRNTLRERMKVHDIRAPAFVPPETPAPSGPFIPVGFGFLLPDG